MLWRTHRKARVTFALRGHDVWRSLVPGGGARLGVRVKEKGVPTMQYQHILVTHDGSELAETAIAHVEALASAFGSRVTVLRVVETVGEVMMHMAPTAMEGQGAVVADLAEDVVDAERETAAKELKAIADSIRAAGAKQVDIAVEEGTPGQAIVDTAVREGCDLIVMATHGRSGLTRAVLGSVADHVLHHAPCPVLLCRSTD